MDGAGPVPGVAHLHPRAALPRRPRHLVLRQRLSGLLVPAYRGRRAAHERHHQVPSQEDRLAVYAVTFSAEELKRLGQIFSQGVSDWLRPVSSSVISQAPGSPSPTFKSTERNRSISRASAPTGIPVRVSLRLTSPFPAQTAPQVTQPRRLDTLQTSVAVNDAEKRFRPYCLNNGPSGLFLRLKAALLRLALVRGLHLCPFLVPADASSQVVPHFKLTGLPQSLSPTRFFGPPGD